MAKASATEREELVKNGTISIYILTIKLTIKVLFFYKWDEL